MSAILRKCLGDLRRHRTQALVIGFIVLLASGTGVIALTLMAQSSNPYDTAFAQQNGAHLQAYFDARKVQAASLPATARAIGATEYSGPYPSGSIVVRSGASNYVLNLIARDSPDATVDRIRVVTGRWASSASEVVITKSFADLNGIALGAHVTDVNVAGTPQLQVVGEVVDIDEGQADLSTQTAFSTTRAFASLTPATSRGYVMLYRFAGSPTEHQLASAVTALRHVVPAGALGATVDYILFKQVLGRWVAWLAVLVILTAPVVLSAWGTDYPDAAVVSYLTQPEIDALLAAPDRSTWE